MKTRIKKIGLVIVKTLTMLGVFLTVIGGSLATSTIDSASLPIPASWRPYMTSAAFAAIALKYMVIPSIEALVKGIKQALVELDKPDEN